MALCRILHGNLLIGTIPKEIGLLKNLKVLDLGANQLTGPIPPQLGNLANIMKMLVELEFSRFICTCLYQSLLKLPYFSNLNVSLQKLTI